MKRDPETAKKVMAAWVETHDAITAGSQKAVELSAGPMRIPADELMPMTDGFIYRVEFTKDFLATSRRPRLAREQGPSKPGQGDEIIKELAYPDLLRSVAPDRVDF